MLILRTAVFKSDQIGKAEKEVTKLKKKAVQAGYCNSSADQNTLWGWFLVLPVGSKRYRTAIGKTETAGNSDLFGNSCTAAAAKEFRLSIAQQICRPVILLSDENIMAAGQILNLFSRKKGTIEPLKSD